MSCSRLDCGRSFEFGFWKSADMRECHDWERIPWTESWTWVRGRPGHDQKSGWEFQWLLVARHDLPRALMGFVYCLTFRLHTGKKSRTPKVDEYLQ